MGQQAGEVCMDSGRMDVLEQIATVASEFEAAQKSVGSWKSGRGGTPPVSSGRSGFGGSQHDDDERMARELQAQMDEEERTQQRASGGVSGGTPAMSSQSARDHPLDG